MALDCGAAMDSSDSLGAPRYHEKRAATEKQGTQRDYERRLLTPINEPSVVLLEGFGAVSFLMEMDRGDSLGASRSVEIQCDLAYRADSCMEKLFDLGFIHVQRKIGYDDLLSRLRLGNGS
jgi:hypothetical protein